MKTKLTPNQTPDNYEQASFRWDTGYETIANVAWENGTFYVWFECSDSTREFIETYYPEDLVNIDEFDKELEDIGVNKFWDIDEVNNFCEAFCGDRDPATFDYDEANDIVYAVDRW